MTPVGQDAERDGVTARDGQKERIEPKIGRNLLKTRMATNPYLLLIVTLGLIARFGWFFLRPGTATAEAAREAVSFAQGVGLSNAYFDGQGPTAHLLPIPPMIAGSVYYMLGIHSPMSEFVLACWSIGLSAGSALMFYSAFAQLGMPRRSLLIGLGCLVLLPTYINLEVVDFRIWDGGLAVFIMSILFNRIIHYDSLGNGTVMQSLTLAITAAFLFFVNPIVGVSGYTCCFIYLLRTLNLRKAAIAVFLSGLTLALLIMPWILRNELVLGTAIPLRSNGGIELAISMYPGAELQHNDTDLRFARRMAQVHPYDNPANISRLRDAGGEVAYSQSLLHVTTVWMVENPFKVFQISVSHLQQIYFPSPAIFRIFAKGGGAQFRSYLARSVGFLGLIGLIIGTITGDRRWIYPAVMIVMPGLLMMMFQPVPRYTYLIYGLLCFSGGQVAALGSGIIARAGRWRRARRQTGRRSGTGRVIAHGVGF